MLRRTWAKFFPEKNQDVVVPSTDSSAPYQRMEENGKPTSHLLAGKKTKKYDDSDGAAEPFFGRKK